MRLSHQSPSTNSLGKEVDYQGSRQIDSFTRRYYEKELGAGIGPSPSMKEHFGYTEPFRRFVQHETFSPQANEIPNTAASWLPGDDYYVNFHEGDPFIKVDEGYARLPGEGYAALHPELKDVNQGGTSFSPKRHLGNPLPLMCGMLLYIHIYESFVENALWLS